MRRFLILAIVVLYLILPAAALAQSFPALRPAPPLPPLAKGEPPFYQAVMLPEHFVARAMNNKGVIVGQFRPSDFWSGSDNRAAVWRSGVLHFLPKVKLDYYYEDAIAISDDGVVVGDYELEERMKHPTFPVLWKNGLVQKLEPPRDIEGRLIRINGCHEIIGDMYFFDFSNTIFYSYLWKDNTYLPLTKHDDPFQGSEHGDPKAIAINDRGQIVGTDSHDNIILWEQGIKRVLGTGDSYDINNRGQIVGLEPRILPRQPETLQNPDIYNSSKYIDIYDAWTARVNEIKAHRRPFLLQNGKKIVLPYPSYVKGAVPAHINNRGQIVGYGQNDFEETAWPYLNSVAALLWQNNRVYNLQDRTNGMGVWQLRGAIHINDRGQILCQAENPFLKDSEESVRYFLLEPIRK